MAKEKFEFTSRFKRGLIVTMIVGVVLVALGIVIDATSSGHGDESHGTEQHAVLLAQADDHTQEGEHGESHENASDASHDDASQHGSEAQEDGESHDDAHATEGDGHGNDHGESDGHHAEDSHGAAASAGHGDEAHGDGHGGGHHGYHWVQRLFTNLWINNVFFFGIGIIGVFFFAIQYASQAGWSAPLVRISLTTGRWLPISLATTLIIFLLANYTVDGWHLHHWVDTSLYDEAGPNYDAIIAGKAPYLNIPFFLARMVIIIGVFFMLFRSMMKLSLNEDQLGGDSHWYKIRKVSTIFLIIFAVFSVVSAWDWILSIDTHWFSTMFGWYVFASWFVTGCAVVTLVVVFLHEKGYLPMINQNHLHDMARYVWAFSIFWTYIWFSQFLLIYYANIPEETVYFLDRFKLTGHYAPYFYVNLLVNFIFPFLSLMSRNSKRHGIFLKVICMVVIAGHWSDFFLMITPAPLGDNGGIGLMEIGITMIFGAAFLWVYLSALAKNVLVPKHHPMLEESKHHQY